MLGRARWENRFSRWFSPSFGRGVVPGTGPCTSKKPRSCCRIRRYGGCSCRGPEQHLYYTPYSRHRAFRSRAAGFRACGGRTRARPHGLTLLLGFLSGLPAGFFAPICHSLEGPETSPAGAEQPGTEDAISPRSASLNAPADLLLVQTPGLSTLIRVRAFAAGGGAAARVWIGNPSRGWNHGSFGRCCHSTESAGQRRTARRAPPAFRGDDLHTQVAGAVTHRSRLPRGGRRSAPWRPGSGWSGRSEPRGRR